MSLFIKEVEKVRFCAEFFFEYEYAFLVEDGANFRVWVEKVSKDSGTSRAGFKACG